MMDVEEPAKEAPVSILTTIKPTLQNIVATVNLDCELNLKDIALSARNAEYAVEFLRSSLIW